MQQELSDTFFKDETGTIISLYHWTQELFEKFAIGDIGFHFGTLDAAHAIQFDKSIDNGGYFKEVFLNIKNPVFLEADPIRWDALTTSEFLCREGVFTDEDYEYVREQDPKSYNLKEYDSISLKAVREILQKKDMTALPITHTIMTTRKYILVILFSNPTKLNLPTR